jgi:hypothetical protein
MSYQAVLSDSNDNLINNQAVGMRLSILQNTATGTAVYVETQTVTTNDNGLVTLAIGTGSVLSGDFATIDWGGDSYFIQTEMDPTGGDTYTLTGASQLLSVPYALHSKRATTLPGGIDQGYIEALEARITAVESEPVAIGELRKGGIVFWVDPANNTHGKVCAFQDAPESLSWVDAIDYSNGYTNSNTGTGVYSDWYLPSKDELQLMYANLQRFECSTNTPSVKDDGLCATRKANFSTNNYWSSTEVDGNRAWIQYFSDGFQGINGKGNSGLVRAVRAF